MGNEALIGFPMMVAASLLTSVGLLLMKESASVTSARGRMLREMLDLIYVCGKDFEKSGDLK